LDGSEVARIRRALEKTQVEIAHLLGVSTKAVQSFEQGWRPVPGHVERQLLLLLYLNRGPANDTQTCWHTKRCPPEIKESCVAWQVGAGHLCWFITGCYCEGRLQENWQKKMELCRRCDVFRSMVPALEQPETVTS
jgi:hypothetical protein